MSKFKNNDIFKNIILLPNDIKSHVIIPFISNDILLFTCKKYYEDNIIKYRLTNSKFSYKRNGTLLDSYIRRIITKKYYYIFSLLIKEKYSHWVKIKGYKYKNYRYKSFMDALEQICIELNSTKCRNYILSYKDNVKVVRKNKYKKMRSINNIWSN